MNKTWLSCSVLSSLLLVGCVGESQSSTSIEEDESSPWSCDSSVDAFGEGTHRCLSVSRSFEGSIMGLVLYCSSRTDTEPEPGLIDPSWIQAHFSIVEGNRIVDRLSTDRKIEVSIDGGPKRQMERRDRILQDSFQVYPDQPSGLGHKTTGDEQMQFLWGKNEITLRTSDRDGKVHSGRISLEKMDETLEYLAFLGGCTHHVKMS